MKQLQGENIFLLVSPEKRLLTLPDQTKGKIVTKKISGRWLVVLTHISCSM